MREVPDGASRAQALSALAARRAALVKQKGEIQDEHGRAVKEVEASAPQGRDATAYERNTQLARDEMRRWKVRHEAASAKLAELTEALRERQRELAAAPEGSEVEFDAASLDSASAAVEKAEKAEDAIQRLQKLECKSKKANDLKAFRTDFISKAAAYKGSEPQFDKWVEKDAKTFEEGNIAAHNLGIEVSNSLGKYRSMLGRALAQLQAQNAPLRQRLEEERARRRERRDAEEARTRERDAEIARLKAAVVEAEAAVASARARRLECNDRYREAAVRNARLTRVQNVIGRGSPESAIAALLKAGDTVIPDLEGRSVTVTGKELAQGVQNEINTGNELKANLKAIRERLGVLQAKTPLASVAPCRGVPHGGSHECPTAGRPASHSIERTPFAGRLARELHRMINAARTSNIVKRSLGITSMPDGDETQWMIGVLVCWDVTAGEIKVLYAASGQRLGTAKADVGQEIWCSASKSFVDFNGREVAQSGLQRGYQEAYPDSAETAGQLGRCAAPKMLNYAAASEGRLVPFEMAEITFEPSAPDEHGKLMHSCHKCRFGLAHWLCGLDALQDRCRQEFTAAKRIAEAAKFEAELEWLPP
ncbi:hypothetical protein [Sorangium sp. So ce1000]|uniref:hypothetical protein n=1 Tax=Sorangium sp. So ce1000 TaxID=3133325 RepID=UPI003F60E6C7